MHLMCIMCTVCMCALHSKMKTVFHNSAEWNWITAGSLMVGIPINLAQRLINPGLQTKLICVPTNRLPAANPLKFSTVTILRSCYLSEVVNSRLSQQHYQMWIVCVHMYLFVYLEMQSTPRCLCINVDGHLCPSTARAMDECALSSPSAQNTLLCCLFHVDKQ